MDTRTKTRSKLLEMVQSGNTWNVLEDTNEECDMAIFDTNMSHVDLEDSMLIEDSQSEEEMVVVHQEERK